MFAYLKLAMETNA